MTAIFRLPRAGRLVAALLAVVALSTVEAVPARAAGPVGYVRLAHLSPDTPDVDVYLSSVPASGEPKVFNGVGYGVMSNYLALPTGTYAVAMRGAGAPATDPPVLTTNVTVDAGKAYTVAGVGKHADLGLKVIDDDLSLPPAGKAKVRIVQASLKASALDVSLAGGQTIASGVPFATTTGYQLVTPGRWDLKAQGAGNGPSGNLSVNLASGNVYSLLVLDGSGNNLTAQLRVDAQRSGGVPDGGVETGAGGTADRARHVDWYAWGLAGLAAALLLVGAVGYRGRRRVARP